MSSPKRSYLMLVVFLLVVAGVATFGAYFEPGDWYARVDKPFWTPPNWVFGPVWAVLYVLVAIAGWLIFSGPSLLSKYLWVIQLFLNGIWSWLFFGLHRTGLALLDIVALIVCIALLLVVSYKSSRTVVWLLAPYLLWVCYASTLNAAIYLSNPPVASATFKTG